ncbi:MAG: DUF1428 domain-containing protein [Brevundimonas sp.]|jgi:uncharacterized protein YbaA (DUF1428 family)|uniref:DUF1428 domain-containing protein n=3 Tax=Brevundimonas sp. TaxID=1871086 RepID=UPI0022CCE7E9|nr:DUF1428 domain-containing protein [Brevundimonas sp.]MCZ8087212.1 DUF1428 domain-containing protein [Brevundimonas sp.]MCZ8193146.1 DUF1428 domain-containing protein [Brevundimonas sp.]
MTWYTGFLIPVKAADKDRYIASAKAAWPLFEKYGALQQVETWGEDVPDGTHTSFPMAVKKEEDEVVVLSWIKWPDRATADACFATMESDPAWQAMDMPFDGKRMMWGGFAPIFES